MCYTDENGILGIPELTKFTKYDSGNISDFLCIYSMKLLFRDGIAKPRESQKWGLSNSPTTTPSRGTKEKESDRKRSAK